MVKVKVRFLQSAFLPLSNKSYGYNDEEELDQKLANSLKKNEIVDILKPEKGTPQKPESLGKKEKTEKPQADE